MKKQALITGAANGIGRAVARRFAESGWHVWAADTDQEGLETLKSVSGISTVVMDVTSDRSVEEASGIIRQGDTVLDVIVNNAGIDRYFPFSEASPDSFREIFEVNLFGAYRVNRAFLPLLRKPGGKIFHLGSESLRLTVPFMPYPLTKKALESYSRVLRQELKFSGIEVITIRPGAIRTRILENVSGIRYPVQDPVLRKAFQTFAEAAPREVGKVASPERLAELILKICDVRRPKAVYRFNNSLRLRIASLIPYCWMEKFVYRKLSK
ncbi:MAG TPA: SDR family NAD(P)-dependent oxidoreductase [Bacteroidales bacterium]|nr:SDR family NAD(P)-dependent oxidoreductase [Bacteroidales bacterium]